MIASPDVLAERERCALIAEDLAGRWEARARRTREEGTFTTIFGNRRVAGAYEKNASIMEAAADGLRSVAFVIRSGAPIPEKGG